MVDKFLLVGLKADLPAVRDANKLYWCSDTRELYKGMDLYTEAVRIVSAIPATPAQGVLYVLPTGEAKVFNGTDTVTVAKPYVDSSAGVLTAANTDDQVATAKVVYDSIVNAVSTATDSIVKGGALVNNIISTKAGTITVTKGEYTQVGADAVYSASVNYFEKVNDAYVLATVDASTFAAKVATGLYVSSDETDVAVKGVVVNPTYDNTTRTITLPYADGTDSLVISLGKDIFVDPSADNKYNAETGNIELFLNDGSMSYEAIETVSTQSGSELIKLTARAIYDPNVTDYFSDDVQNEIPDSNVTAENFADKVASGLYVYPMHADKVYPNITSIYTKESDGSYTKVTVNAMPGALGEAIINTSGNAYFGISSSTMIAIPASSLVDIYTGDTSSDGSTTVSVSSDNKITASVNISEEAGNKIVKRADGLYVDAVAQADFDTLDTQVNSVQTQVVLKENGTATGASYTFNADDKFLVDGVETTIASESDLNTTLADNNTSVVAVVGKDGLAKRLTTAEAGVKTNADAITQLRSDVDDTIANLEEIHVDPNADNKYDNTTGNINLYLNDSSMSYEAMEIVSTQSFGDLIKLTANAIYVKNIGYYTTTDGITFTDDAYAVTADNFAEKVASGLYIMPDREVVLSYPDVTSIYVKESDGTYTEVPVDIGLDHTIKHTPGDKYFGIGSQPTKIEVPVAELKAAVAAIDTINTTLKDGIYVEVASTDKFDVNTTYFVLSNGEFVEDNTVSAANFDAKVAAGLYVIASDAIELLAAKVDANAAAIKQNADDIEAVSYTKCTTNTVYNPAIPYYTVDSDGKYVVDSSVISAATYETAVATGKCYTKTTDAIVENEGRIAAIENALTWGTF